MSAHFHFLVRGVVYVDGYVLLAQAAGADHTFLPGGHAEPGEGLVSALRREFLEELGVRCEVESYLGAVEHAWEDSSGQHYEVNHVFEVRAPNLRPGPAVMALDPQLKFLWSSMGELDTHNLQPYTLRALLRQWSRGDRSIWWASTVSDPD